MEASQTDSDTANVNDNVSCTVSVTERDSDVCAPMTAMLRLQRAALEYMDATGAISDIKERCQVYSSVQDKAFHFIVPVNPSDLLELHAELGNLVLSHSSAASKVFQEVVYVAVEALSLLSRCTALGQVVVVLRIQALPSLPSYVLDSSRDLIKHVKGKQFLQYEGVVCGMSVTHKYTKVARFRCPEENCSGHDGDKFIRIHIPGAREAQTIRKDFTCTYCGSALEEDISCRVLGERVIAELVDEGAFSVPYQERQTNRFQTLVVYLREDLLIDLEIGQKITVIGLPVWDLDQQSLALEANNVIKNSSAMLGPSLALSALPTAITALHKDREMSPWSFVLSLGYAFAGEIAPVGSFLQLKLGMLMSLVSMHSKDVCALDLLAVGSDATLLHRLLSYGAGFRRTVVHSVHNSLTATVNRDKYGSGACFIQGGSLLLAHDGICLIRDLNSCKKSMQQTLLQAMERGSVFVDVPQKVSKQTSQQLFLPRRSRVWSYVDPGAHKRASGPEDLGQSVEIGLKEIGSLADVFGLVCFTNFESDSFTDQQVMEHTMNSAMGVKAKPLISQEDFKQFLNVASQIDVHFDSEAERLIRGYYVASRRKRMDGTNSATLPVTAVNTITSLASAHARLSLRSKVTEDDAVMAVYLYEESVTCRYGSSVLNVQPLLHIRDNDIQLYIGVERDCQLREFHKQLVLFVATYATGLEE